MAHFAALAGIMALMLACVVSGADRSGLPLLGPASCSLPTPRSCITQLAIEHRRGGPRDVLQRSEKLARSYPGIPGVQALHGAFLTEAGRVNEGGKYLLNSARLGWREPAGQSISYLVALDEGDAPRAALHLDTLLKLDPGRVSVTELMTPAYADPALRSELAARLAVGASYLPQFLRTFADDPETAWDNRIALLDEARVRGLELPEDNVRGVVWPLFRRDPFKALDVWLALAGAGDFAKQSLAWDATPAKGDLASAVSPFQWHERGRGSRVRISTIGGSTFFLADGDLYGPARDLVALAVPLRPGVYPVQWKVVGQPDSFFLSASCVGNGRAELTSISPVVEGKKNALLVVDPNCPMPTLSIAKARGDVADGSGIGSLTVAGRPLLS